MDQAESVWKRCVRGIKLTCTVLLAIGFLLAMILPQISFLIRLPGLSPEDSQAVLLLFCAGMSIIGAAMGEKGPQEGADEMTSDEEQPAGK